jgi:hypothetical protein
MIFRLCFQPEFSHSSAGVHTFYIHLILPSPERGSLLLIIDQGLLFGLSQINSE